jgi:hypothetical protein
MPNIGTHIRYVWRNYNGYWWVGLLLRINFIILKYLYHE